MLHTADHVASLSKELETYRKLLEDVSRLVHEEIVRLMIKILVHDVEKHLEILKLIEVAQSRRVPRVVEDLKKLQTKLDELLDVELRLIKSFKELRDRIDEEALKFLIDLVLRDLSGHHSIMSTLKRMIERHEEIMRSTLWREVVLWESREYLMTLEHP